MTDNLYLNAVRQWLEKTVIGLNLCPFAKQEFLKNKIRFTVSSAATTQQLLQKSKNLPLQQPMQPHRILQLLWMALLPWSTLTLIQNQQPPHILSLKQTLVK